MFNKFKKIIASIAILSLAIVPFVSSAQSVLFPYQGGTGIGSVTSGEVGQFLRVLDDSPFTFELAPAGTGGNCPNALVNQVLFSDGTDCQGNPNFFYNATTEEFTVQGALGASPFVFEGLHVGLYGGTAPASWIDHASATEQVFVLTADGTTFGVPTFVGAMGYSTTTSSLGSNVIVSGDAVTGVHNDAAGNTISDINLTDTASIVGFEDTTGNGINTIRVDDDGIEFTVFGGGAGQFYRFPTADGNASDVLTTDGLGQLSWAPGGGVGACPNALNTQILFSNGTDCTGEIDLTFDSANNIIQLDGFYIASPALTSIMVTNPISPSAITGEGNTLFGAATSNSLTSGQYNTLIGNRTGRDLTTGTNNVHVGASAGENSIDAINNTIVGAFSGFTNTGGVNNVFLGNNSGYSNTTGNSNIFLGQSAGYTHTTGNGNVLIGQSAGYTLLSSGDNVIIGKDAGYDINVGSANVFMGASAGANMVDKNDIIAIGHEAAMHSTSAGDGSIFIGASAGDVVSGFGNLFIGFESGLVTTAGEYNLFVGFQSGMANDTAGYNTFIGNFSGKNNNSGTAVSNSFLGYESGLENTVASNNTFVGAYAGKDNTTSTLNSYFGSTAGTHATGAHNVYLGYAAGAGDGSTANSGANNVYIGYASGSNNTTGNSNIFIGHATGDANTTGFNNAFVGTNAGGANTTGNYNTFFGTSAGAGNTVGDQNTFIGDGAGLGNTSGGDNVFIGDGAGAGNVTHGQSTGVGVGALAQAPGGVTTRNTALGWQAGANLTAEDSTFVGHGSGNTVTTGHDNVGLGQGSASNITTGDGNLALGTEAQGPSTGSRTVLVGNQSSIGTGSISDAIALGFQATVKAANQFVVGSETSPINTMYIGEGVQSATPSDVGIFTTSLSGGSDGAGSNLTIGSGAGVGPTVTKGDINFATPDAAGTGNPQSYSTKLIIDQSGDIRIPSKTINTTAGDSATIDSPIGRFRKDTSGATFTLTDAFITANSIITLTPANAAIDTTALSWTASAGTGSATITFNAAPTANFDMNFMVLN